MDVDNINPTAVEPTPDGWTATQTRSPLMPDALLGVALLLAWRFIGIRFMRDGAVQSEWIPLLLGGVLPTLFILLYPLWAIRRAGGRVFGGWPGWTGLLLETAIAFGVLIVVQTINVLLAATYIGVTGEKPGVPEQFQDLALGGSFAALLFMALMACLWAPIAEELFFRRFVMRAFAGRLHLAAAIGLQAFVFAIVHDYGGLHLGAIFVLGLAMGGVYAWRRTILTSMILHMLQNTIAMSIVGAVMFINRFTPPLGVMGDAQPDGFHVVSVQPESSAAVAGLQAGDIIKDVEDAPVEDALTLRVMYWAAGLDGKAELTIKRGDETIDISVRPQAATAK
ncbi:MAG: CPBP family intramembrane metalloprotease [Planctomycetaceae bacterium]|nr:CPBP family intramembrane metalloprotease [Planctomycetaceae bacterium]